jgi:hypothetical protein
MSVGDAVREAVDAAVVRMRRAERDRLARILLKHGLTAVARDVECADDDGEGDAPCVACDGHRAVERYERGCLRLVDCEGCGATGKHQPSVTA